MYLPCHYFIAHSVSRLFFSPMSNSYGYAGIGHNKLLAITKFMQYLWSHMQACNF